jgi:hypothetical protein
LVVKTIKTIEKQNGERLIHAYRQKLADEQFAGFAPAFTLSFHDRKSAR